MITLGTNLAAKVVAPITAPRLFLVMTFGATVNRWTTGEDVTWDSNAYSSRHFEVEGLGWEDGGITQCKIRFSTNDQVMIALLLGEDSTDAPVQIYLTNKMASFGTDDVIQVFDGEITELDGKEGDFAVVCEPTLIMSPREYDAPNWGANTLDGPGIYNYGALGVVTIG